MGKEIFQVPKVSSSDHLLIEKKNKKTLPNVSDLSYHKLKHRKSHAWKCGAVSHRQRHVWGGFPSTASAKDRKWGVDAWSQGARRDLQDSPCCAFPALGPAGRPWPPLAARRSLPVSTASSRRLSPRVSAFTGLFL